MSGQHKPKIEDMPKFSDFLARKLEDPEFAQDFAEAKLEVDFALALADARERAGMSQQQVADAAGMKQPLYNRYEKGGTSPGLAVLQKLARVLHARVIIEPDGSISMETC